MLKKEKKKKSHIPKTGSILYSKYAILQTT